MRAQAIGARRLIGGAWRVAGELGRVGALSFFPSKNLGAWGDAGMMLTQDDALAERLRKLRLHGGAKQYHHEEVGINSRLDTLQAAVLLVKLRHLASWSAARRAGSPLYRSVRGPFRRGPAAGRPCERAHLPPVHHSGGPAGRAGGPSQGQGDRPRGLLSDRRCTCSPCFAHLGYRRGSLPATEQAMARVLSLPIYPELTGAAGRRDRGGPGVLSMRASRRDRSPGTWGKNHVRHHSLW